MAIRDIFILVFAVFVIGSAFGVALLILDSLFGFPWSGLVATAASMGALKLVSESPTIRLVNERARLRKVQREEQEQDRRMRRALSKAHLLTDREAPKPPFEN